MEELRGPNEAKLIKKPWKAGLDQEDLEPPPYCTIITTSIIVITSTSTISITIAIVIDINIAIDIANIAITVTVKAPARTNDPVPPRPVGIVGGRVFSGSQSGK